MLVGDAVTFDTAGPSDGSIGFTEFGSEFTMAGAGVYKISFAVVADVENQIDVLVNGADPLTGPLVFGAFSGETNEGTAIIAVDAGDIVTLTNLTSTDGDLVLSAPRGGTETLELKAWIVIEQISTVVPA